MALRLEFRLDCFVSPGHGTLVMLAKFSRPVTPTRHQRAEAF
jgi:hypothetical protein